MKVYEAVSDYIAALDTTVFGLIGAANMMLVHQSVSRLGVKYVGATREDGAVLMAMGYAEATGRPGLVTITHGPAFTNTVTALTEASRHNTSLVVIAISTPAEASRHLQRIDIRDITRPTGATYMRPRSPKFAVQDFATAVATSIEDSTPVVYDIPLEMMDVEANFEPALDFDAIPPKSMIPSDEALDKLLGIVASANRPLILAGRGASSNSTRRALLDLSERLGAPITTTLLAKDLFAGEECNFGLFGTFSEQETLDVIEKADLIVAFGVSFSNHTTYDGGLVSSATVAHIDTSPESLNLNPYASIRVVGDATVVSELVVDHLAQLDFTPRKFLEESISSRKEPVPYPEFKFGDKRDDSRMDMRDFLRWFDDAYPSNRTVVCDAGHFLLAPVRYLSVTGPDRFVDTVRFGSIGLGLATAIGVAEARPSEPVVVVVGDGGVMMGWSELMTAVEQKLDIVVLVMNDGSYGAEYHHLSNSGLETDLSLLPDRDFAAMANAFGARGVKVDNESDLVRLSSRLEEGAAGPIVVDVKLDPSVRIGFKD